MTAHSSCCVEKSRRVSMKAEKGKRNAYFLSHVVTGNFWCLWGQNRDTKIIGIKLHPSDQFALPSSYQHPAGGS